VPPKIKDQAVLARLITLAFVGTDDTDGAERGRRRHDKRPRAAKRGA
jgi:hypothetical protein